MSGSGTLKYGLNVTASKSARLKHQDNAKKEHTKGKTEEIQSGRGEKGISKLVTKPVVQQHEFQSGRPGKRESMDKEPAPAFMTVGRLEPFEDDVRNRPDECGLHEYDARPISEFGARILGKLGWREGCAVGRSSIENNSKSKSHVLRPVEFARRPELLGLGARMADGRKANSASIVEIGSTCKQNGKMKAREPLGVGSRVRVCGAGPHAGVWGRVVAQTENSNRRRQLVVEVARSRVRVTVPWRDAEEVDQADIDALERGRQQKHSRTHEKEAHDDEEQACWVRAGLQVRVVSKTWRGGAYYGRKAVVVDVLAGSSAVLAFGSTVGGAVGSTGAADEEADDDTELGVVAEQSVLETVVPRVDAANATVVVVRGNGDGDGELQVGRVGRVVARNKRRATCTVAFDDDDGVAVVEAVAYDDVCVTV